MNLGKLEIAKDKWYDLIIIDKDPDVENWDFFYVSGIEIQEIVDTWKMSRGTPEPIIDSSFIFSYAKNTIGTIFPIENIHSLQIKETEVEKTAEEEQLEKYSRDD